ncbi:protein of unknown function [Caballeronia sp. S22]
MDETFEFRISQETQTFVRAKKKRAWSPLKTTRYGVSARRPHVGFRTDYIRITIPAPMPQNLSA